MTKHQSPTTGALIGVLQDARDAIASLDEDALGYAHDAQNTVCWPIRDELMAKIGSALDEALSRPSPIAEPQDSDAAFQKLIARVEECQRDCPPGHNNLSGRLTAIRETIAAIAARLEAPIAEDALVETLKRIASGEAFRAQRFAEDDDCEYFVRAQREVQQEALAALQAIHEKKG